MRSKTRSILARMLGVTVVLSAAQALAQWYPQAQPPAASPPVAAPPAATPAAPAATTTDAAASTPAPAEASTPAAPSAASEAPTPDAQLAPAVATQPAASETVFANAACVLGAHDGIREPDANTSAALVCEALLDEGAHVDPRPVDAAEAARHSSAYRIDMRPLGRLVVLQVSFESPVGTRLRGRKVQLAGIEEVPVGALRIADALMHEKTIKNTASVDTLVGQETRTYEKQYGETLFAFGVLGMAIVDETAAGYGAFLRLYYEAARYAVGADAQLGGSNQDNRDASLVGLSVGGRYFLNAGDITPFVGGGAGILWLGAERRVALDTTPPDPYGYEDDFQSYEGTGAALYGEFGVEFLRLHSSRFDVWLRVEVPTFEMKTGTDGRYAVPILLMLSYSIG